jgi:hypothetical protein
MDEYLSARMVLTGHYRVLQASVASTALQLQLPTAQIVAATERVIACNTTKHAGPTGENPHSGRDARWHASRACH